MMEGQKLKQDEIHIGQNIRRIRLEKGVARRNWCGGFSWRASP